MFLGRSEDLTARATLWLVRAGAAVLAGLTLLTFLNVAGRKLFNSPIVGTVEMTELCMGLIVFFGIAYTTHKRAHVSVDILTSHLPGRAREALALFSQLASTLFAAAICWRLWIKAGQTLDDNLLTQIWEVPVYPVAYLMAAGSTLMVVVLGIQITQSLQHLATGR